jgi:hypothetical protein
MQTATSKVENLAEVLFRQMKLIHGTNGLVSQRQKDKDKERE